MGSAKSKLAVEGVVPGQGHAVGCGLRRCMCMGEVGFRLAGWPAGWAGCCMLCSAHTLSFYSTTLEPFCLDFEFLIL